MAGLLLALAACGARPSGIDGGPAVDGGAGLDASDAGFDGGSEEPRDAATPPPDAALPESMSVLFVGNSYTAVNDLPAVVTELMRANGVRLTTEVITEGGAKLCDHHGSSETRAAVASEAHDAVVIQGQSTDMFYDGESAAYCGRWLGLEVPEGTSLVWFATWARREGHELYDRAFPSGPDEMSSFVESFYRTISEWGPGGHVARVGNAWLRVLDAFDDVELHAADGSHPTAVGTFVTACVMTQALLGRDPELPATLPFGIEPELGRALCDLATEEPCFDALGFCDGSCQAMELNELHCGACGNACGENEECWGSECRCERATTVPVTAAELTALDPDCDPTATRPSDSCASAAHRVCADVPCANTGFGPRLDQDSELVVTCTQADLVSTTFDELAGMVADCDGVTSRGGDGCLLAAHEACRARGHGAGFGPVSIAGGVVQIACLDDVEVAFRPDVAFTSWGCGAFADGGEWDAVCDDVVHRMCPSVTSWSPGGYGRLPADRPDGANIVCIRH